MNSISRKIRIGYGVGEIGIISIEVLLRVSLLIFYTDHIGLHAHLAGYAIAVATIWDAITDPLMGKISDQIPVFQQRRRPYILLGAFLLGISVVVLFFPPDLAEQWQKCAYLAFGYIFVNTSMTIVSVPYSAFGGDLTSDERIRTELFGWRLFFGNLGFVVGTIMPAIIGYFLLAGDSGEAVKEMDAYASVGMALICWSALGMTWFLTKGLDQCPKINVSSSFSMKGHIQDLLGVLQSPAFFVLIVSYLVATLGLTLNSSLALYYYRYRLQLEEVNIRLILTVFMFVFSLSIPLWVILSRRFNKYKLISWSILGLGLMTCIVYPIFPVGNPYYPLIGSLVGGVFVGAIVLLDVAVAEIAETDQKEAGRFGMYFGFWRFAGKLSRAFALAITGIVLTEIGFVSNQEQTAEVSQRIAYAFGPGVGCFLILSAAVLFFCSKVFEKS